MHQLVFLEGAKLTLPIIKDSKPQTNLEGTPGSHNNTSCKKRTAKAFCSSKIFEDLVLKKSPAKSQF